MSKVRAGIEIPIIPEDFETSTEAILHNVMESCLDGADRKNQDELYAVEWAVAESLFDQCSWK